MVENRLSLLAQQIPAHSKTGTDHYLILGFTNGDALAIDQDGDLRTIDIYDLQTEWVYMEDPGIWVNRQLTMEDLEDAEADPDPLAGSGPIDLPVSD